MAGSAAAATAAAAAACLGRRKRGRTPRCRRSTNGRRADKLGHFSRPACLNSDQMDLRQRRRGIGKVLARRYSVGPAEWRGVAPLAAEQRSL